MNILCDIDDTLYDSFPVMTRCFRQMHAIELDESDRAVWDFYRRRGLSRIAFESLLQSCYHDPTQVKANVALPGAAQTLRAWHRRGHKIHIVSDRRPDAAEATLTWLSDQGIPYAAAVLEHRVDKLAYALSEGISLVIDDRPSFLAELVREPSITPASLREPKNAALIDAEPRIVAAPTWRGLRRALERALPELRVPVV